MDPCAEPECKVPARVHFTREKDDDEPGPEMRLDQIVSKLRLGGADSANPRSVNAALMNSAGIEKTEEGKYKQIDVKFKWSDIVKKFPSDAFKYFVGNDRTLTLSLECIGEAEAETTLLIGQLDHFQTVAVRSMDIEKTTLEIDYVGKMDPAGYPS